MSVIASHTLLGAGGGGGVVLGASPAAPVSADALCPGGFNPARRRAAPKVILVRAGPESPPGKPGTAAEASRKMM